MMKLHKAMDRALSECEAHTHHITFADQKPSIIDPLDVLPTPPLSHTSSNSSVKAPRKNGLMRFNISGRQFIIPRKSLLRHPKTKLGVLAGQNAEYVKAACDYYIEETDEYYFERNPHIFEYILGYYRHGECHIPDVCPEEFLTEMTFWRLTHNDIADCCKHTNQIPDFLWRNFDKYDKLKRRRPGTTTPRRATNPSPQVRLRQRIWRIIQKPFYTKEAMIFSGIGIFFISLILLTIILHSYPQFTYPEEIPTRSPPMRPDIENTTANSTHFFKTKRHDYRYRQYAKYSTVITVLYIICAIWFTAEYALRLYAAPNRWIYFRSPLAIVDLICMLPFYADVVLYILAKNDLLSHKAFAFVQITQVLQIFRLVRYSRILQFLGIAIKQAYWEIFLFIFMTFVMMLFFGVMVCIVERGHNPKINNIPDAMYFTFITVTTVGYGDVSPATAGGKVLAAIAAFTGVLILAFPISLVVSRFSGTYDVEMQKRMSRKERRGSTEDAEFNNGDSYRSREGSIVSHYGRTSAESESGSQAGRGRPSMSIHRQASHTPVRSHVAGFFARTPYIINRRQSEVPDQYPVNNGRNRRMSTDAIQALHRRLSGYDMPYVAGSYVTLDNSSSFNSSRSDSDVFEEPEDEQNKPEDSKRF